MSHRGDNSWQNMVTVFLVTLYENSPMFYIGVVTVCFVITAAMVLGCFVFDVPVILRTSDEATLPTPEKKMVQVTNPFALELGSGSSSVAGGVALGLRCLEPCVLSCFWGCGVRALQGALQGHAAGPRLCTPRRFQEALGLQYQHCQSFQDDGEPRRTQMPADLGVKDFGPLPRERYPLVAVLTLAEPGAREAYNIVSSVTVLHVPDCKHRVSARILFQYLLTSRGNVYELKPLFMSGEPPEQPNEAAEPPEPRARESEGEEQEEQQQQEEEVEEDEWSEGRGRDCVVCQNAPINRVLLPCRHACVCDGCVSHFQLCPICRAVVMESFTLSQGGDG